LGVVSEELASELPDEESAVFPLGLEDPPEELDPDE
jgi:hypothetical protein